MAQDFVNKAELKRLRNSLEGMKDAFTKAKQRSISRAGAKPVREAIKDLVPVRKDRANPLPYYRKGQGANVGPYAFIRRGNLNKSIRLLPVSRTRNSAAAWIGPQLISNFQKGATYGGTVKTASGYTAWMALRKKGGSWEDSVLGPATSKASAPALRLVEKRALIEFEKQKKKLRF